MRKCSTCRLELPEDRFDRTKKSADGLAYWCRDCRALYHRRYKSAEKAVFGKTTISWPERLWEGARRRAAASGIPFDIEPSDIAIPERCPVFGTKLIRGAPDVRSRATLDRIDNSRGYVKGNVAVISHRANSFKGDMTADELQKLATYARSGPSGQ